MRKNRASIPLTGMGVSPSGTARAIAQVTKSSVADSSFHLETEYLALARLTSKLPPKFPGDHDLSQFDALRLSDPYFYKPNSVGAVLGFDVCCRILQSGLSRFPLSSLIAQDTVSRDRHNQPCCSGRILRRKLHSRLGIVTPTTGCRDLATFLECTGGPCYQ